MYDIEIKFDMIWYDIKELIHAEMGVLGKYLERVKRVLRAAHPRTPFQGEYSPGGTQSNYKKLSNWSRVEVYVEVITSYLSLNWTHVFGKW